MNELKPAPMSFLKSLEYFGIPWLLFILSIYLVIPALGRANVPLFINFLVSLGNPLGLLILASLVAYQQEGGAGTWTAFKSRFRLESMPGATWLWTVGLSIFMFLAPGFLDFSVKWIQNLAPVPGALARMFEVSPTHFMGIPAGRGVVVSSWLPGLSYPQCTG